LFQRAAGCPDVENLEGLARHSFHLLLPIDPEAIPAKSHEEVLQLNMAFIGQLFERRAVFLGKVSQNTR
jgi:hypothetical protein